MPNDLIQIEEPTARSERRPMALGLAWTDAVLFAAVSVGGNAEFIPGTNGEPGLLPVTVLADCEADTIDGVLFETHRRLAALFDQPLATVIAVDGALAMAQRAVLLEAFDRVGLELLQIVEQALPDGDAALDAARLADEMLSS